MNLGGEVIVTSSKPDVAYIAEYGHAANNGFIGLVALKKGTTTIKIASNDGTGKSATVKLTVQ